MPVEILRGHEACARLGDRDFLSAWTVLYDRCPWGTVFQSPAFACVWYCTYEQLYEPLLVFETGSANGLSGLLLLAVDRRTGELTTCGVPNAEYYVWLARAESDGFIIAALRELWKQFPRGSLRFLFLPPKTPLGWRLSPAPEAARTILIPIERPLCLLSANSASESLRKKSNRSRLNRLERLGELRFVEIRARAELEPHIDRIAEYCNQRQAAINGSIPFQEDAPKREFLLRLADEPSVAHCTALMLNGEPIAMHFGFKNRAEVVLGLIAHSPSLDRHSPGKLLLLFLIEKLAATGYERFDLTPGGSYKDRFHNAHDEAFRLWAFARKRDYLALRLNFAARRRFKPIAHALSSRLAGLRLFATQGKRGNKTPNDGEGSSI